MNKFNSYVRPILLATLTFTILHNYTILTWFDKMIDFPPGFWAFCTVFGGVYGAGRSYEKAKDKTSTNDV